MKIKERELERRGTGFVISNTHILTALHVLIDRENETVDDIKEIQLTLNSGTMKEGLVEKYLEDEDLAVVKSK